MHRAPIINHHFDNRGPHRPCWRRLRHAVVGLAWLLVGIALLYGLGLAGFIGATGVMGWLS